VKVIDGLHLVMGILVCKRRVKRQGIGNFSKQALQPPAAVYHPGIEILAIGVYGTLLATEAANRQAILGMPSLNGTATAAHMPGNRLPAV
jgi:hypothetical protein